jgi:hypothetical protein
VVAGDFKTFDQRKGGGSYQAAHDPRIHFGLGARDHIDLIEVIWPSGKVDKVQGVGCDRVLHIREGSGLVSENMPE